MSTSLGRRNLEVGVKISERCNIDCSYCYYYNMGNKSWKDRPATLTGEALDLFKDLLNKCNDDPDLEWLTIILHGGEPLLLKEQLFREICSSVYQIADKKKVQIGLTTNGILISDLWLQMFHDYRVAVSISIDGPQGYHDAARLDKKGQGTYSRVIAGARKLLAAAEEGYVLPPSAIAVANPLHDGAVVYRHLASIGFKSMSFILPDGHAGSASPEQVQGLCKFMDGVLDAWRSHGDKQCDRPRVTNIYRPMERLLRDLDQDLTMKVERYAISIDSSGAVGLSDVLRSVAPDRWRTMSSSDASGIWDLYEALCELSTIVPAELIAECSSCELLPLCGGGVAEERFNEASGFNNPSVHCGVYKHFYPALVKELLT